MLRQTILNKRKFLWIVSLGALIGVIGIIAALNQLFYIRRFNNGFSSAEGLIMVKLTVPCTELKSPSCYSYKVRYGDSLESKYTKESTENHEVGDMVTVYFRGDDKYFELKKPYRSDYAAIILPIVSLGSCFVLVGIISVSIKAYQLVQSKRKSTKGKSRK